MESCAVCTIWLIAACCGALIGWPLGAVSAAGSDGAGRRYRGVQLPAGSHLSVALRYRRRPPRLRYPCRTRHVYRSRPHGGGRLNQRTTEDLVELVTLRGKPWLLYHAFPVHVGFIRATAADPFGNLVMDDEGVIGDVLPIAQAAHNHGGLVIAQVYRLLDKSAVPQHVRVPGRLVSHIVVADEEDHWQTFGEVFNPAFCSPGVVDALPLDESHASRNAAITGACDCVRIIALCLRRTGPGAIANLGIGTARKVLR